MNKKNLPVAPQLQRGSVRFDLSANALDRWQSNIKASTNSTDNTISIYDPIGYDYFTGDGVTAKRVAAALRQIGDESDVIVNINSPGGDTFEGLAIYNLLRNHGGKVTINIMGLAASAASIIAMAGDEIRIARSGFLMIHNCWICVVGNKNDFGDAINLIGPFDKAMADIYSIRSGIPLEKISSMMDAETWIIGNDAVEQGFADSLLPSDQIVEAENKTANATVRKFDALLARAQVPRAERKKLLHELKNSMSGAAVNSMSGATEAELDLEIGSIQAITNELKVFLK